ncbi:MAG TPA: SGNH/GDSL hydrolase family protein [Albitalea sp.]
MFRGVRLHAAARHAAGLIVAAMLLTACGGGGEQVERFVPTRLIAFGDENSVIVDSGDHNGRKYSVNYATAASAPGDPDVLDCAQLPIWIQSLVTFYGLVLPQCNAAAAAPSALIEAEPGTFAADVTTQVDAFLAAGESFNGKDLVTVLAGQNDILREYELIKAGTVTEAQAIDTLEAAGTALAAQVNRIGQAGGKVIIATVPDMGLTPYAVGEGDEAQTRLSLLSARFNSRLRVGLINDGRMIGLVLLDEIVQSVVKAAQRADTNDRLVPVVSPACASAVPACSLTTLNTATTPAPTALTIGNWLWSDTTHLGVLGHSQLGSAARSRASNNPF